MFWAVLRIRDPGSWFLLIPDPGSKNSSKREGWKKIVVIPFFCSHKFHIIENNFFLNIEEKNLGQFSKNYRTFYLKNWHQALKNMGLVSGIRDPEKPITDPGSRGQNSTRSQIPDPDLQHWFWHGIFQLLKSTVIDSASLCSLRHPIPTPFLASVDSSKIPALEIESLIFKVGNIV